MFFTVLGAVLAASAPEAPKLAAPGFSSLNMTADQARYYANHFAHELSLSGLRVLTSDEIAAVVGVERQRTLLGCQESGCITELANALGVDGIVTGSIGQFGQDYQIDIKVLSARDGHAMSVVSTRVQGNLPLLDELTHAASWVAADLTGKPREDATPTLRRWWWIPATAGVAFAAGAVFFGAQAQSNANALRSPTPPSPPVDPQSLRSQGQLNQGLEAVGIGLAVAGLAAGAGLWILGGPHAPVAATVGPTGAAVSGAFP